MNEALTPVAPLDEANRIYRAIFRQLAPAIVIERFVVASEQLHARTPAKELEHYSRAIGHVTDLEALELAGRYRGALPLLSAKFRLMVYLAETVPENQRFFVAAESNRLRGVWTLCAGGLRSGFKLAKGFLLLAELRSA